MKDIEKNRFLIWLMWVFIIGITGPGAVIIWTMYQWFCCQNEKETYVKRHTPLEEREDILELNKVENLTEKDWNWFKNCRLTIKTDARYWYQYVEPEVAAKIRDYEGEKQKFCKKEVDKNASK